MRIVNGSLGLLREWWPKIFLALASTICGLALIEVLMETFPYLLPRQISVNPPVHRVEPVTVRWIEFSMSDGDLFSILGDQMAPLPPGEEEVLAAMHIGTDGNGFRNPPPLLPHYDVVAIGDSFTVAWNVASPWPDSVADELDMSVLNLGVIGYGPQGKLSVLRKYGLQKNPTWVIMGYFEGNDLHDTAAYEQKSPFLLPRFAKYVFSEGVPQFLSPGLGPRNAEGTGIHTPGPDSGSYVYPLVKIQRRNFYAMSFNLFYISWLSVDRYAAESSGSFRILQETVLEAATESRAVGACFLLVYFPSKPRVYLPYVASQDTWSKVTTGIRSVGLSDTASLELSDVPVTPDLVRQNMDGQAEAMHAFAAREGIQFLNLTPDFQHRASSGDELYYEFDTHWNQKGHDFAAEIISEYIIEQRCQ